MPLTIVPLTYIFPINFEVQIKNLMSICKWFWSKYLPPWFVDKGNFGFKPYTLALLEITLKYDHSQFLIYLELYI